MVAVNFFSIFFFLMQESDSYFIIVARVHVFDLCADDCEFEPCSD